MSTAVGRATELTDEEHRMLAGDEGRAVSFAMRVLMSAARAQKATHLIPITSAHVDGCLYHGPSSLDFVRHLIGGAARVRVPTTLNVGGLDLHNKDIFLGPAKALGEAAELMDAYVALGCRPTFTCAPYQLPGRPSTGEDVAWAESNAIVFGNSMIGLRTNRYGDLIDVCAAIAGRVPYAGLHVPENRAARAVFTVDPDTRAVDADLLPALLGHHVSRLTGTLIPVLDGLADVPIDDDWGKAFGAAAASGGGVAMFHIAGVTPEAPDLQSATRGLPPLLQRRIAHADLMAAHRELTSATLDSRLGGVSLGTPHMSRVQLADMAATLAGRPVRVPTYATTSRAVTDAEPDAVRSLERSGVTIVRDTCIYGPSKVLEPDGAMMTNSAKWAYYAPAQLGYQVVLASRRDCLESAVAGRILVGARHD